MEQQRRELKGSLLRKQELRRRLEVKLEEQASETDEVSEAEETSVDGVSDSEQETIGSRTQDGGAASSHSRASGSDGQSVGEPAEREPRAAEHVERRNRDTASHGQQHADHHARVAEPPWARKCPWRRWQ